MIAGIAVVAGALQHAVLPGGLWSNSSRANATIEVASLPTVAVDEARSMRDAGTATIVDARPANLSTTLPAGVISIPIGLSQDAAFVRAKLDGVPLDRTLLVHCGDARCGQSRVVAAAIRRLGWTDVRVIRGEP